MEGNFLPTLKRREADVASMPSLFAIGGGEIADAETEQIDRKILAATDAESPRVLFVPTASGDAEEYWEKFHTYFGETLECETDVLWLLDEKETVDIDEKIESADVIYVGGGDTGFMLDTWRTRGIDEQLREAWEDGTVMAGLSAGALCWVDGGLSDAIALEDIEFGPVDGLGFVSDLHLTVHATQHRREVFADYLATRQVAGVALENNTAIEVSDDEWRIHTSSPNAFAFHLTPEKWHVAVETLPVDGEYREISELQL